MYETLSQLSLLGQLHTLKCKVVVWSNLSYVMIVINSLCHKNLVIAI